MSFTNTAPRVSRQRSSKGSTANRARPERPLLRAEAHQRARAVPSGGAAGGIAAGLYGVLGARLFPGVDWVLDAVGFDTALDGAALCFTAEGQLDRQSLRNKGPLGVARRAAARGIPVVALCGSIAADVHPKDLSELTAMFSICPRPMAKKEALRGAARLLEAAAEQAARLFVAAATGARSALPESPARSGVKPSWELRSRACHSSLGCIANAMPVGRGRECEKKRGACANVCLTT
jgi:hypothetical protein